MDEMGARIVTGDVGTGGMDGKAESGQRLRPETRKHTSSKTHHLVHGMMMQWKR